MEISKAVQLGQIYRDVTMGLAAVELTVKYQLSISEARALVDEIRRANRDALHNRVKGMFLQGFNISELPKYFGLTESEIRAILEPKETPGE